MDYLHYHLITEVFAHKKYFDFGTSNEQQGKKLNKGLSFWKEGFGANTVSQDFYMLKSEAHHLLEDVLI